MYCELSLILRSELNPLDRSLKLNLIHYSGPSKRPKKENQHKPLAIGFCRMQESTLQSFRRIRAEWFLLVVHTRQGYALKKLYQKLICLMQYIIEDFIRARSARNEM